MNRGWQLAATAALVVPALTVAAGALLYLSAGWPVPRTRPALALDPAELVRAAHAGRLDVIGAAVHAGISLDEPAPYANPDLFGRRRVLSTPLFAAVAHGDADVVNALIGAGVNLRAPGNLAAVCLAAERENHVLLGAFARAGVEIARARDCVRRQWPSDPPATGGSD